jgi:hypothetical protein
MHRASVWWTVAQARGPATNTTAAMSTQTIADARSRLPAAMINHLSGRPQGRTPAHHPLPGPGAAIVLSNSPRSRASDGVRIWRMASKGTPATALLTRQKIAFTAHPYRADPHADSYGEAAARALGVDPGRVFTTLVASVDGRLAVGVVPVSSTLDLKARSAGGGGARGSGRAGCRRGGADRRGRLGVAGA